jgi:hypothetical protein
MYAHHLAVAVAISGLCFGMAGDISHLGDDMKKAPAFASAFVRP